MRRSVWMILGALALGSSIARADIAPPAPEDITCPRGAVATLPTVRPDATDERGRPIRPWPYCAPSTCASDADCTDGRVCSREEIGLCVQDQVVPGGDRVRSVRERGCEPDGTCLNVDSTCERARRCVPPGAAAPAEAADEAAEAPESAPREGAPPVQSSAGCGCRAPRGAAPSWPALALAALVFLLRRARR